MSTQVKEKQEIELLRDNIVKKIFSGESESSRMLIASIIEEVTNHEFDKEEVYKSMVMDNNYVAYNINTIDGEVDTLLHTDDIVVNFEYNTTHYRELDIKNNTYICNLILKQLKKKEDYSNIRRVIQINLNNYDLFKEKEFIYCSVYMDKKTKKIRPNNISEIYDVNLALLRKIKYNKVKEGEYGELKRLLYFLINNDKKILDSLYGRDKVMEDIQKKIEQVTDDLDYLFYYKKEDLERMRDERERREGREEGIKENTIIMIKSMLENNLNYETISKVTGKSVEEIKEIEKTKNDYN